MKNLQHTEKQLADKLQNVPVPDVDQSWEQMRKLLDDDMPEPAAGAWSGNRKWWWMGITAALIMLGTWFAQQLNDRETLADKKAGAIAPAANKGVANSDVSVVEKKSSSDKSTSIKDEPSSHKNNNEEKHIVPNNDASNAVANNKPKETIIIADKKSINTGHTKTNTPLTTSNNKTKNNKIVSADNAPIVVSKIDAPVNQPAINNPAADRTIDDNANNTSVPARSSEIRTAVVNTSLSNDLQPSKPADAFNEIVNFEPEQLAVSGKTDRAFAKEMRQKSMKADNRRLSRSSMRGRSSNEEKEITFAAGLALPQSFAVSGQQSSSYNIAAKNSRITDYLPAPFFQYHINNKLFLQTEFHFQSPQYTQRLLLSRTTDTLGMRVSESNVHLEKLYYFNIPFNLYYSPARNFYIGGGLQYSSLLSGVASFEQKSSEGQNVLSYNSMTRRFKDDSVAAVFSPSEWRYQFDANYYFNRFTLGLRFNQAMKDFINMPGGSTVPFTKERNKSFLLYLRFNIWEERKKIAD